MKNLNKTIIVTSIAIALTACGGGGGGSSTPAAKATMKGKAIDGYITGATAYLDVNYNGKLDSGEPSTITDENGEWTLISTGENAECSQYVPTVIMVPVGATDSDYGEVSEAYEMTFPPSFAVATNEDLLNATPLTTVVWSTIQNELTAAGTALTCANVKGNYEVRERIQSRLDEQEFRVAQRYNVTVDELYSDYIAEGNSALHAKAVALVPSMQASYADTVAIEAANPNAQLAWVEYFNGEWDERSEFAPGWYKEIYLNFGDSGWSQSTESVTDDLITVTGMVDFYKGSKETVNGLTYEWTTLFSDTVDNTRCVANEWIEQDQETGFGVRNTFTAPEVTASACDAVDWNAHVGSVAQQLTTRVKTANSNTTSQHFFTNTGDTGLAHLVKVNPANIEASELDAVNFISTDFANEDAYGAALWSRIQSVMHPSSDVAQVTTTHTNTNAWSRTTTYTNGKYVEQCSYDGGKNWTAKAGGTCEQ
ncbi:hypothetical protein DS893_01100 [Vibrionales bacterium C3R12]|nr:hypothetical protein DS893_01100 [Vibrionales bacterium C3R12]